MDFLEEEKNKNEKLEEGVSEYAELIKYWEGKTEELE